MSLYQHVGSFLYLLGEDSHGEEHGRFGQNFLRHHVNGQSSVFGSFVIGRRSSVSGKWYDENGLVIRQIVLSVAIESIEIVLKRINGKFFNRDQKKITRRKS